MKALDVILLASSVITNAAAHISFKIGAGRLVLPPECTGINLSSAISLGWTLLTNPFIMFGALNLLVGTGLWLLVLSRIPLSIAHPILSVSYVLTAAAGFLWFHEPMSTLKVLGLIFIIIGVSCVANSL